MRLRYRAQALSDIDGIHRYLDERSPSAARTRAASTAAISGRSSAPSATSRSTTSNAQRRQLISENKAVELMGRGLMNFTLAHKYDLQLNCCVGF
jgi:plasmid stabilization system protein ParE